MRTQYFLILLACSFVLCRSFKKPNTLGTKSPLRSQFLPRYPLQSDAPQVLEESQIFYPFSTAVSLNDRFAKNIPAFIALLMFGNMLPEAAFAAADAPSAIASAFVAYGHYFGLLAMMACVVAERLLLKPGMTEAEEFKVIYTDIAYGLVSVIVVITGYLRATEYGKGWEFYSHEPIFWVKLALLVVLASSSFFPTTKFIQRAIEYRDVKNNNTLAKPLSEKLVDRIHKIINGEILALLSIPLAATLMSRGVGYVEWFPWQAGAGPVALLGVGLSFKYIKEALEWKEDK